MVSLLKAEAATAAAPRTPDAARAARDLLLAGRLSVGDAGALAAAGLASHALERAAELAAAGDAGARSLLTHPGLRSARSIANARHAAVRAVVAPLVSAWREAGVDVLVFKGFYLAEAVYAEPAHRLYSDVDVALRPRADEADEAAWRALAARAADVARALGWTVVWRLGEDAGPGSFHLPEYDGHELLQLRHRGSGVNLDAHRRLVHNNLNARPSPRASSRLTDAVWAAARPVAIGEASALAPSPLDSALVGIVAARSWSGDRHALRPHDYLDLQALMRHGRFGRAELLVRARELGLVHTLRAFLARCDPDRRVLDLGPVSPAKALRLDLRIAPERFPRAFAEAWRTVAALPRDAWLTLRALQALDRVRRGGASAAPGSVRGRSSRRLDKRAWDALQRAAGRALRLDGRRPQADPALARAVLAELARVSGYDVEHGGSGARGWLAWEGVRLPLGRLGLAEDHAWPAGRDGADAA